MSNKVKAIIKHMMWNNST